MGHCIDAKISPKAASEKAQTKATESRYIYPRIHFFWMAILLLLASVNRKQGVGIIFSTPGTMYLPIQSSDNLCMSACICLPSNDC